MSGATMASTHYSALHLSHRGSPLCFLSALEHVCDCRPLSWSDSDCCCCGYPAPEIIPNVVDALVQPWLWSRITRMLWPRRLL